MIIRPILPEEVFFSSLQYCTPKCGLGMNRVIVLREHTL